MAPPESRSDGSWKLILAWLFFAVPFVVYLVLFIIGTVPFISEHGMFAMLCGGFTIAMLGVFPLGENIRPQGPQPDAVFWVLLFIGLAMWCAAPVIAVVGGEVWSSWIGSAGRGLPIWGLAALTWGTTALCAGACIHRQIKKRRKPGSAGSYS